MKGLAFVLVGWLGFTCAASASLAQRRPPRPERDLPAAQPSSLSALARQQAAQRDAQSEYVLTDETEITLNGKACKYAEIPAHARILWMEVALDRTTVLRVHFRARK